MIVSAPTGAGKTLVAEFAIHRALDRGRRIAYTTPLKALSNQKYADFCRQFGADHVGILTGDVKVNARAPVVVMTTEILRNMFYTGGLEGLDTVVLDECHYMGDEGRGTVWEEIIVNCPRNVALVALSATVANVDEIADWISLVHRPIVAITHPHRPVPLPYLVADLSGEIHAYEAVRARQGAPARRGARGRLRRPGPLVHAPGRRSHRDARRAGGPRLAARASTSSSAARAASGPWRRCWPRASRCSRATQQRQVDEAIREAITDNPTIAESPLNQTIFQALGMGVGLHHAGILPSVKRLIELLFERGLCKVVFATETMSLGIHMPAKSVVLQSLTKRTDRGFRSLTHNELTQMAGRAGRRGIDPEGKCVMALDVRDGLDDMRRVVDGPPEPIASQFKLGYGSVALLLVDGQRPGDDPPHRRVVVRPVPEHEADPGARGRGAEPRDGGGGRPRVRRALRRLLAHRPLPAARAEVEAARMARGPGRAPRAAPAADAEPGRLALVAAQERAGPRPHPAAWTGGATARSSQRAAAPRRAPSS